MISSEVQRTLVKSPPELWAELSDPAALARHLGELGEIRITRVEPEKLVEWEAERTKGTVAIKPSGWGTKVTLSVNRELAAKADAGTEDDVADEEVAELARETEAVPDPTGVVEAAADTTGSEQQQRECQSAAPAAGGLDAWASQAAESEQPTITAAERFAHDDPEPLLGGRLAAVEDEPEYDESPADPAPQTVAQEPVQSEPRRGLFARLFGRRGKQARGTEQPSSTQKPLQEQTNEAVPSPESPALRPGALMASPSSAEARAPQPAAQDLPAGSDLADQPKPAPIAEHEVVVADAEDSEQTSPEQTADLAAELMQAEEAASEEVTAVLTGMLDRLGAAHHRPFSRS